MKILFKIRLIGLALLLPLGAFSLQVETAQKLDEANESYIQGRFDTAIEQYQDFIETAEAQKPDASDKKLIDGAKEALQELELLKKFSPLLALFQRALPLETQDPKKARDLYFQIRETLRTEKITEVIFFSQITQGILKEFLIQKRKDSLENFSAAFLERIKEDKKRKKTIVFLDFEKDKTIEFDVQTLVVQNLTNVIEASRSFNISSRNFQGSPEQQVAQAKAAGIDLAATGSYKKAGLNAVQLTFFIIDPYKNQRLIEVSVRAPLDFEFFDSIEKVASDLDRNLRNYSRFEDFASIRYKKEEGKRLVKEVTSDSAEKKENLAAFIDQKIFDLENAYIASLLTAQSGLLKAFDLASREIAEFNLRDFPKKISEKDLILTQRPAIIRAFSKETGLYPLLVNLDFQRQYQYYDEYYSFYEDAKEILTEGQKNFPGLAAILKEDLENPLDRDKAEVDAEVAQIGFKDQRKYGIRLSFSPFFNKEEEGHTESGGYYPMSYYIDIENDLSFSASIVFEQHLFGPFWFYSALGGGLKQFTIGSPSDNTSYDISQPFISLDLGFKTGLFGGLSLAYGIRSEFYLNSGAQASAQMGPPFLLVGLEYGLSFESLSSLEFSLGLHYMKSLGSIGFSIEDPNYNFFNGTPPMISEEEYRLNSQALMASLTVYYKTRTYNFPEAEQGLEWVAGIVYAQHEFQLKEEDFELRGMAPGVSLGLQIRPGLFLALDTFVFSAGEENDYGPTEKSRGYARGIIQKLTLELDVVSFWKLGLFLNAGLGYSLFYEKSFEKWEWNGVTYFWKDKTSELATFSPYVFALGAGIRFDITDWLRLKVFVQPPSVELTGLEYFSAGMRAEFKI